MSPSLADTVAAMLRSLDAGERDGVVSSFAADAQGVDELTRAGVRGGEDMTAYIDGILETTSDVTSEFADVHVTESGDLALVTGILVQQYTLEEVARRLSVPTTFALRRTDGDWRIILFHSVPIPDCPGSGTGRSRPTSHRDRRGSRPRRTGRPRPAR